MNLKKLINPSSVAVVGVTDRMGAFGHAAAIQTVKSSISDHVYYVHPKREELYDRKCYKSLQELPEIVDCLVICTPRDSVINYLEEAGQLGIGSAIVYASGFSEEHSEEGAALEKEIVAISQKYDMPVLGPNCAGILNNEDKKHLWGLRTSFDINTRRGGIGIIAQSGFIAQNLLNNEYFNISYAISSGNGNATMLEDFFLELVDDPRVKVMAIYLEGVKDASKFGEALKKAALLKKPVVILKSGKSSKGAAAAASHTGNLAGSSKSYAAAFEKFGVISVDSIEEFMCAAQMFSVLGGNFPRPARFAGLNLSGGENTLCADLSEKHGVPLPDFAPQTISEIEKFIPSFATASNPLDGTTALFSKTDNIVGVLKSVEADPNVGGIIFGVNIGEKISGGPPKAITDAVIAAMEAGCKKPVFMIPSQETKKGREVRDMLESRGIVLMSCGEIGYSVLGKLAAFLDFSPEESSLSFAKPDKPLTGKTVALTEAESKEEMAKWGLPVPGQEIVASEEALSLAVSKMNYPLVLKINSPDILHKTEAGGVALGIETEAMAVEAYRSILKSCKEFNPQARLEGVLVQEMVPSGTEIIIGIKNDAQFGPMLLVGLGGVFVEVFQDAQLSPCPVSKSEALSMVKKLKAYKLLSGYRGKPAADIEALTDLMVRVSDYAVANKNTLKELDLNPVFVYDVGKGAKVVDALVVREEG